MHYYNKSPRFKYVGFPDGSPLKFRFARRDTSIHRRGVLAYLPDDGEDGDVFRPLIIDVECEYARDANAYVPFSGDWFRRYGVVGVVASVSGALTPEIPTLDGRIGCELYWSVVGDPNEYQSCILADDDAVRALAYPSSPSVIFAFIYLLVATGFVVDEWKQAGGVS